MCRNNSTINQNTLHGNVKRNILLNLNRLKVNHNAKHLAPKLLFERTDIVTHEHKRDRFFYLDHKSCGLVANNYKACNS